MPRIRVEGPRRRLIGVQGLRSVRCFATSDVSNAPYRALRGPGPNCLQVIAAPVLWGPECVRVVLNNMSSKTARARATSV